MRDVFFEDAYEAGHGPEDEEVTKAHDQANALYHQLRWLIPALRRHRLRCVLNIEFQEHDTGSRYFVPCGQEFFLGDYIMHLNDFHRFSREQIADWLDHYCWANNIDQTLAPSEETHE